MRVSRRAQHAVVAILDLAIHPPAGRGVRSAEVARRSRVPEKFLEAIWRDLREAGLVESRRGRDGGHRLAVDPSRVTLSEIVSAIDGPLSGPPARGRGHATPAEACVRSFWERVATAAREVMERTTLEDLRRESSAPGPLDFNI